MFLGHKAQKRSYTACFQKLHALSRVGWGVPAPRFQQRIMSLDFVCPGRVTVSERASDDRKWLEL